MKPYTWEEIKDFLIKELKKTKHIMTFGTIGSCNVEHDIDTIITKKPSSSSSEFYKEIHNLFDNINNYLMRKYGAKVIRFAQHEPEALRLSNAKNKDLAFQVMIYTNYSQIERDWAWALFEEDNLQEILKKNYKCLIGNVNDLFSNEFQKRNYYEPVFTYLYFGDRINSHYPIKLFVQLMNQLFDYLFRKRLGLKPPVAKNEKEVREIFYNLCDILDKLNKEKEV